MQRLHQNVALVTGAGSGIGRAAAIALAEAGWRVILVGRRSGPLQSTADAGGHDRMAVMACDVADEEAVERLFNDVEEAFGRLDLLFTMPARARFPPPLRI